MLDFFWKFSVDPHISFEIDILYNMGMINAQRVVSVTALYCKESVNFRYTHPTCRKDVMF